MRVYRWLLRLLPRDRRERFGDEMAIVFAEQTKATGRARGNIGVARLWMKEIAGLVGVLLARSMPRPPSGGRWSTDLRWAWRGVRARGWRAIFIVMLLAVAMAANTVVFSAADAFVFNRAPFPDAAHLAVIERTDLREPTDYLSAD